MVLLGGPFTGHSRLKNLTASVASSSGGRWDGEPGVKNNDLEKFEERLRFLRNQGALVPFPVACWLAGVSDTRLRFLASSGRLGVRTLSGVQFVRLRSLVKYRREALRAALRATPQVVSAAVCVEKGK